MIIFPPIDFLHCQNHLFFHFPKTGRARIICFSSFPSARNLSCGSVVRFLQRRIIRERRFCICNCCLERCYDGGSCAYTGEQTASSGTVVIGNNYATITITGSNTATGTYTNGATGETSSISLTRIQ